ncbi:hypothetical protein DFH11DRAFT_1584907 [Phellopilus nigrolimitatus]|nr:hypothetical protein DFH11DRAFT_1584907 [Phellopilus nigrolimitatus]
MTGARTGTEHQVPKAGSRTRSGKSAMQSSHPAPTAGSSAGTELSATPNGIPRSKANAGTEINDTHNSRRMPKTGSRTPTELSAVPSNRSAAPAAPDRTTSNISPSRPGSAVRNGGQRKVPRGRDIADVFVQLLRPSKDSVTTYTIRTTKDIIDLPNGKREVVTRKVRREKQYKGGQTR